MGEFTTIGLDIAKHVFQVHGVDETGSVKLRRKLRRSEVLVFFGELGPGLVGMETCATAHYWARSTVALARRVKLMPPTYLKPSVKRRKNDAADAGEAVRGLEIIRARRAHFILPNGGLDIRRWDDPHPGSM